MYWEIKADKTTKINLLTERLESEIFLIEDEKPEDAIKKLPEPYILVDICKSKITKIIVK